MHLLIIIFIAISLSMDAFSLALAYGTQPIDRKKRIFLSFIVGIYHFIMPLLGFFIGHFLIEKFHMDPNFIIFLIFLFIGIQMILDSLKKENQTKNLTFIEMLLFGLAVSLDSFSIGLGLQAISNHIFMVPMIFSMISALFTYLGLSLGNKIQNIFGQIATIVGGIFLILIGILYFFK